MAQNLLSPELNAKVKKNLLWFFIFAVIMIFAGFTSAYIVQQGGSFWVNITMPSGFTWSTVFIIISSVFLLLAVYAAKKNQLGILKIHLALAFVFGLLFGIFQFVGFNQLIDKGCMIRGPIINLKGRYGDHYSLLYQNKEISYDNNQFYWKGEEVSGNLLANMKSFAQDLYDGAGNKGSFKLQAYGSEFMLKYEGQLVTYVNNSLQVNDKPLDNTQLDYLKQFADNIINDVGDFIVLGEYGRDFWVYYKGKQLDYDHRKFYLDGRELSEMQKGQLWEQNNHASAYIYIFVGMHLLHWLGGIIALLIISIRGLQLKYSQENYLGITLGSIYWHFLGILWLYLYAFLILIH